MKKRHMVLCAALMLCAAQAFAAHTEVTVAPRLPYYGKIDEVRISKVVRDANGNPSVQSRDLATGRDDVTFGILATPDLTDWSNATLVPMTKFATDGLWRPTASESAGYVFPSQMFFKYTIDVK